MNAYTFSRAANALQLAAADKRRVSGSTHSFYAYPARFAPEFAATAIAHFSKPGDTVCDPYMGGGTTVVEAIRVGRDAVGCDLNELAVFVARVKSTPLMTDERSAVATWAARTVPFLSYYAPAPPRLVGRELKMTRNLTLPRARFIKKIVHLALRSAEAELPTRASQAFARCVLLRVGQWALNGKRTATPLWAFRGKLIEMFDDMLAAMASSAGELDPAQGAGRRQLINADAATLPHFEPFASGRRADLVVTSPPYPKIHVLYHRWQVDGRRETPAPYWIAGASDGQGASFYNFADRSDDAMDTYFARSLETLRGVRSVMRNGGYVVQMLAFGDPHGHLPRYLHNMRESGFREVGIAVDAGSADGRIWRNVPNRKWHATLRGRTSSSREVVLIHQAV